MGTNVFANDIKREINMNKKSISDVYGYSLDNIPSDSGDWLVEEIADILRKAREEATPEDAAVLIRQDRVLSFAIPKALEFLKANPLAGEMYEGELLKSLAESKFTLQEYKDSISKLIPVLRSFSNSHEFELPQFKKRFDDSVDLLEEDKSKERQEYQRTVSFL